MSGVRLGRAAELLGVSRPTIEQLVRDGRLKRLEGTSPATVDTDDVLREMVRSRHEAVARVARLDAAMRTLTGSDGNPTPPADAVSTHGTLTDELARERTGRALAEARIDELKEQLRRVTAAARALLPSETDLPSW